MMDVDQLVDLALLPDAEWRMLCAAMNYYLRRPERTDTHPLIAVHFPNRTFTLDEWSEARLAVTEVRLKVDEARFGAKPESRKDYMRLYMRRRRMNAV